MSPPPVYPLRRGPGAPVLEEGAAALDGADAGRPLLLARIESLALAELAQARSRRPYAVPADPIEACLGWDLDLAARGSG